MRGGVLDLSIGLLELRVVFACMRLELSVVNEQDRRDAEHGDRGNGNDEREPALIGGAGADTERARAEAR